jgi:hypothetical protein
VIANPGQLHILLATVIGLFLSATGSAACRMSLVRGGQPSVGAAIPSTGPVEIMASSIGSRLS